MHIKSSGAYIKLDDIDFVLQYIFFSSPPSFNVKDDKNFVVFLFVLCVFFGFWFLFFIRNNQPQHCVRSVFGCRCVCLSVGLSIFFCRFWIHNLYPDFSLLLSNICPYLSVSRAFLFNVKVCYESSNF